MKYLDVLQVAAAVIISAALGMTALQYNKRVNGAQHTEKAPQELTIRSELPALNKRITDLESDVRVLKEITRGTTAAAPAW